MRVAFSTACGVCRFAAPRSSFGPHCDGQRRSGGGGFQPAVLPVVPMFHANAWGMPYGATLAGARQVFPGQFSADPAALADLIEQERVTVLAGVPTVWIGLLQYLEQ